MIPVQIRDYLRDRKVDFEPHVHRRAVAAQRLAAAEHTAGRRVAKVVVAHVDGELALAVISANQQLDLEAMRQALGAREVALAAEASFVGRFAACEPGAEPPLRLFGLPLYVDARLALEPRIVTRGGTHEDALELDTDDWLLSERVRIVDGLGKGPAETHPA